LGEFAEIKGMHREFCRSLKTIVAYIESREKELFANYDLTPARFDILSNVYQNPGINYIDLSNLICCTKGNTTRLVASMMRDKILERVENPEDRRSYNLFLSDIGNSLYKEVEEAYQKELELLMQKFNNGKMETYTAISIDIAKALPKGAC
jgi:DNA-binding MarR family transcriptional regulator